MLKTVEGVPVVVAAGGVVSVIVVVVKCCQVTLDSWPKIPSGCVLHGPNLKRVTKSYTFSLPPVLL